MKLKEKRELLFRILFGQSFHENESIEKDMIDVYVRDEKLITEKDKDIVFRELSEIVNNLEAIDAQINQSVERWNTKTMARIELSILRVIVYELYYKKDVPVGILANDAVTWAAAYGQDSSYRFVNGAISKLLADLPQEISDDNAVNENEIELNEELED